MLAGNSPRDRIILSALKLAETNGWRDLSLSEIASDAGVPLVDFRRKFTGKAEILAAFTRAVDEAVLQRFEKLGPDGPRDRLFDVILTRLEIMQPYKPALRRIRSDMGKFSSEALNQLAPALKSQYWMLAAAGINSEGGAGAVRVHGLLSIYAYILDVWLDDDDPGMARTMAALDNRLRRAEAAMRRVRGFRDGVENLMRSFRRRRDNPKDGMTEPSTPQQI